jgi:hypothetical protein
MSTLKKIAGATAAIAVLGVLATGSAEAAGRPTPTSRGAPGPIAGAGLPILAAAGVYWFIRRRTEARQQAEQKGTTGSAYLLRSNSDGGQRADG